MEHLVAFWILKVNVLMAPYCSEELPAWPLDNTIIMTERRWILCSKINI